MEISLDELPSTGIDLIDLALTWIGAAYISLTVAQAMLPKDSRWARAFAMISTDLRAIIPALKEIRKSKPPKPPS